MTTIEAAPEGNTLTFTPRRLTNCELACQHFPAIPEDDLVRTSQTTGNVPPVLSGMTLMTGELDVNAVANDTENVPSLAVVTLAVWTFVVPHPVEPPLMETTRLPVGHVWAELGKLQPRSSPRTHQRRKTLVLVTVIIDLG